MNITTDYIHIDDHQHNALTARFIQDWLLACFPRPYAKKVWFAQLNIIPLRYYIGEDELANSRKSKSPAANTSADWRGFVNVELSDDEWLAIDRAAADKTVTKEIPGHIDYLLELGKVTFNYTNGSISCALTIQEGAQKGFTVSSFSDNLIEALLTTRLKVQNHLAEFDAIFAGGGGQKRRRG